MLATIILLGFLGQILIYGGLLSYILSYHLASFRVPKKVSINLMVVGGVLFWIVFLITPIIK
ncbi:gp34.51 [Bacillus phage SPO1]|uniref:Gp34.51 n=1 Tax=Bacillus phage SP01 TaxID=2884427 RepID=B6V301_BPSP1|nr:gp34.51 [Bacillus phage SPO1]ACI91083.1 gp34.51 [Bacillus phage SPO1]